MQSQNVSNPLNKLLFLCNPLVWVWVCARACACVLGLDVSFFSTCLTASIWSWDSMTAAITPLCWHKQTHMYARAQWMTALPPCDRPATSTCSQQAQGYRGGKSDGGMRERVWLEAWQETDTGMDKKSKNWWVDGWKDGCVDGWYVKYINLFYRRPLQCWNHIFFSLRWVTNSIIACGLWATTYTQYVTHHHIFKTQLLYLVASVLQN